MKCELGSHKHQTITLIKLEPAGWNQQFMIYFWLEGFLGQPSIYFLHFLAIEVELKRWRNSLRLLLKCNFPLALSTNTRNLIFLSEIYTEREQKPDVNSVEYFRFRNEINNAEECYALMVGFVFVYFQFFLPFRFARKKLFNLADERKKTFEISLKRLSRLNFAERKVSTEKQRKKSFEWKVPPSIWLN